MRFFCNVLFFFLSSSGVVSVSVFYEWSKKILPLPMWPREVRGWTAPISGITCSHENGLLSMFLIGVFQGGLHAQGPCASKMAASGAFAWIKHCGQGVQHPDWLRPEGVTPQIALPKGQEGN